MTQGPTRDGTVSASRPSRRVTLAEVAKHAGVSRTAAGFVMSGRTDQRLSDETFARVRKAAEELGYRPNITAQTLRTGRSGTVALVSDFVSSTSFANSMIMGALHQLREHDSLLFAVDTEGSAPLEKRVLQSLLDRQVDGIIYASMFTRVVTVPKILSSTPVVLLNCLDDLGATAVVPDEVGAGASAAQLLLDAGHRDGVFFIGTFPPGMAGGAAWHGWGPLALTERVQGIDRQFAEAGARLPGRVSVHDGWDVANGYRAVRELIESGRVFTAIVCVTDEVAVGAMTALREAGISVPLDVSIVSFDGSLLARAADPPLASVALPHEELGRRAVELLFDETAAPAVHRVAMPVVPGSSIAPPSSARAGGVRH